ncbi:MAG: single-stranded DNA-binding protein, partial [Geminicoccaceae bacterium]
FSNEWHRVVIMLAPLMAFAETELQPGDDIYIEGELHTEVWLSETFETRALTKIVLWQDRHQLRRLDESAPATSTAKHHPISLTSREACLFAEG